MGEQVFQAGKIAFAIELRIEPDKMREWEPDRIYQFFKGIAEAMAAAGDCYTVRPVTVTVKAREGSDA